MDDEPMEGTLVQMDGVWVLVPPSVKVMPETPRYSHRNGETEPPEMTKAYFWYQGLSGSSMDIFGTVYVDEMGRASDTFFNMADCHEMQGRWWGPLTPPWEQNV